MSHVLFALFDRPDEIAAAVADLDAAGTPKYRCTAIVHRRSIDSLPSSELALFETRAASMTARMAAAGAAAGALVGLLAAGPIGIVLFTTTTGTMVGALAGVLAGSTEADPTLRRLAEGLEEGKVLLSVEPTTLESADRAEHILREHHARVMHRHVLRPLNPGERREVERRREA